MKQIIFISLFMGLALPAAYAEDRDLHEELEAVRTEIEEQESVRARLRDDLAAMDENVSDLRERLDELEARLREEK